MNLWHKVDGWVNGTTMYRLVTYVLGIYVLAAVAFSFAGVLHYSSLGIGLSLVLAVAGCYIANLLFSWVWNVRTNTESWLVTALILVCIMPPATTVPRIAGIITASAVAMAGKFVLALHGKHVFNPAALGAAVAGWVGLAYAGWWIGTPVMLPFVVIGGFLVARKIRRFTLVSVFVAVSLLTVLLVAALQQQPMGEVLRLAIVSGPVIFLATTMLTEPSTIPPRRAYQVAYAAITAVLFAAHPGHGTWAVTPQFALLAGNLFSFAVSPRRRLRLTLREKRQMGPNVYDMAFTPDAKLDFAPGQYLEWTLPHASPDDRGNRRTFTIASSPTEKDIHLGIKFYNPSSSFKRALFAMEPGQQLWAGHVTGDFVLPNDPAQKLVWVAGGIGITPYRSMAQYMVDTKEHRDVVLFYAIADPQEQAYDDVFSRAAAFGLRVVPVLAAKETPKGWSGLTGFLTPEMVQKAVPDFAVRRFYLSGPNAMVANYRRMIRHMGVARRQIVTDYFPGY